MSDQEDNNAIYIRRIRNLQQAAEKLYEALQVVVFIADRKTIEFDAARAALAQYEALKDGKV